MKNHKPRILYVTPVWPGRTATGVHVRALNVLRALQQIGTVEAVLLGDEGASDADLSEPEREIKLAHTIQVTPQGNSGFIEKLRWTLAPAHVAKVFRASLWGTAHAMELVPIYLPTCLIINYLWIPRAKRSALACGSLALGLLSLVQFGTAYVRR
jgi:hypothetical protein